MEWCRPLQSSVLVLFLVFSSCSSAPKSGKDYPTISELNSSQSEESQVQTLSGVKVELTPKKVVDGSAAILRVSADQLSEGTARFGKKKFTFYEDPQDSSKKMALLAIPYLMKPGKKKIQVDLKKDGKSMRLQVPVEVISRKYRSEKLRVNPSKVSPPKKYIKRIIRESREIGKLYKKVIPNRYWDFPIQLPVDDVVTSPFGTKRLYNGKMRGFHKGVDLRAAVGTPIKAPLQGKVVMSKDLYFTGNTVILDHGYQFVTIYAHMSQLQVKKGDVVEKGEVLGLAGATGRVSGPHLHWGAVLSGEKINPLDLFQVMK